MFGWEFPPYNSGGLGTACLGLSHALVERNVDVLFVLPKTLAVQDDQLKILFAGIENIDFCRLPGLLYPYITTTAYQSLLGSFPAGVYGLDLIAEVLAFGDRAAVMIEGQKFDVIHAHDWLSFPAGLVAKKLSGKPLVVHVHATEFDRTGGGGNRQIEEIEKQGLVGADAVITVSARTKEMVVKQYGIDPQKVAVVHNGSLATTVPPLPPVLAELKKLGKKIVLFVGRITLQKGPDYFVKMARKVLDHNPDVYFVVAGSGDMQGQMMREAVALGVAEHLLYAGFVRGEELDRLYQSADLFVLPSVSEPFGITPLEAMANGTPVIVSKQSGVSEIIKHVLKVDFWDTDMMASQVLTALREDSLRQTLAQQGLAEVGGITWPVAAQKVLAVYQRLVPRLKFSPT